MPSGRNNLIGPVLLEDAESLAWRRVISDRDIDQDVHDFRHPRPCLWLSPPRGERA